MPDRPPPRLIYPSDVIICPVCHKRIDIRDLAAVLVHETQCPGPANDDEPDEMVQ
jgi:hypothetical protein